MSIFTLYLNFQHSILTLVFAYARLAIVFYMLPVLGERVLSNLIVKNTIIYLVIIGLWPYLDSPVAFEQGWLTVLVKEAIVGLMLALTLCLPFWLIIALGEILDNQRGATISDSIDPVNGVQSSILSGFMNFAFGAIFFSTGGMRILLDSFVQSYTTFPTGSLLADFNWSQAGELLMQLAEGSILLAAPVMIVMMLAEIMLGIFARYCPQLNPFSLSLAVKSSIAFLVFMLYGFHSMTEKPLHMFSPNAFEQFFIEENHHG